ncbi:MAG: nucleotide exchange factor GrpE [Isosphaeraceae bacterium]
MPRDDPFQDADALLSAFDFAGMSAAREEAHRRERAQLLLGLLGVADVLDALVERCQTLARDGQPNVPVRAAEEAHRRLLEVLASVEVEPMNAEGGPPNLSRHEVVSVRDVDGPGEEAVLHELTRGYTHKGNVLRLARVVVSRPAGGPDAGPAGAPPGDHS